ncbi:MAG TPA: glycosyltransferase [Thermodesulfobacteriota bacterium]|nr:glycosyltransferase [Thermodesulfobacteriota bacterium]
MGNKITILYVFAALPVGGAEQVLVTEVEGLDKNRYRPLVTVISEKGPVGEVIEKMGIPVIPLSRMKSKQFDFGIIQELKTLMQREKVSLVHTHLYDGGKYGRLAAWLAGVPAVVHTVHNIYVKKRRKHHWINWGLAAITDRIIAVSGAVKESLIRYDRIRPDKIQVLYNGINFSLMEAPGDREAIRSGLGLGPDDLVIGVVARLEEQKGHKILLEALSSIPSIPPNLKVLFVGNGKLRSALEAETQRRGLSRQVVFLGTRQPVSPILRALDLFVLPSLWEGFSMALLEAMAMGLPVIATKVGGAAEVITSEQNGYLISPADPKALAEAIQEAMRHPGRFQEMAGKGRETVRENFSKERHVLQLQELYQEVLEAKGVQTKGS